MNIQTHCDNLKAMIASKRMLLADYQNPTVGEYHTLVRYAMTQMLSTNITELEAILQDVQQCIDTH